MNELSTLCRTFSVPASHPALPGHFPERPLVPGVMLLDEVSAALREAAGVRLQRIIEARFLGPLRPGREAELELHAGQAPGRWQFTIRSDGELLARGRVEGEP